MKHLFLPENLQKIAFEKGFKEPILKSNTTFHYPNTNYVFSDGGILYQQIVDWFRNQKILIEIFPIDDWNSWSYKISAEDAMAPFFVAVQYDVEFDDYIKAMNEAISEAFELIK
jgi:hypothetical protein